MLVQWLSWGCDGHLNLLSFEAFHTITPNIRRCFCIYNSDALFRVIQRPLYGKVIMIRLQSGQQGPKCVYQGKGDVKVDI